MRILKIVSSGFEEGGVENGIVLMNPIFKKYGHEIRVMASDRFMEKPRFDDYTFRSINGFKIGKYFFHLFHPYSFFKLKKVIKEWNPDVVDIHTMSEVSPSVFFALRNTPTILSIHGPEEFTKSLLNWYLPTSEFKNDSHNLKDLKFYGKLHYLYIRFLVLPIYLLGIKFSNATVVTNSKYMNKMVASDGIKNILVTYGANLLNNKKIIDKKIIAYVGRLEKYKGVDVLLNAMPKILEQVPDATLILAGEGSFKTKLENLVINLGIESNVKFIGFCDKDRVGKLYEESTLVVVPSIWVEAFGKVGIEAMSVGRPVVASNVGGMSDWLIDGRNGYFVSPGNHEEISDAVIKLLMNKELMEDFSKNARLTAEKFTLENHVKLITKIYKVVANKD